MNKNILNTYLKKPGQSTITMTFMDINSYVFRLLFTGRLNFFRLIQKRVAHVQHVITHYCNVLCRMTK